MAPAEIGAPGPDKKPFPCPFCGNQGKVYCDDVIGLFRGSFAVRCDNCGARGLIHRTWEGAIDAWNHGCKQLGQVQGQDE